MTFRGNRLTTLVLATVLLMGFDAAASKARLTALGQNANGSMFILDNRDIFLNPVNVNDLGSSANFEWGGQQTNSPTRAEGGGIYRTDSLNYAVQLGRIGDSAQSMISANSLGLFSATPFYPQDSLDAIIGGGSGGKDGVKWGAGLHYARSVSNTGSAANYPDSTARELSLDGGAETKKMAAYLKLDVIASSSTDLAGGGSIQYSGTPGGEAGGKYNFNDVCSASLVYSRRLFGFNNGTGTQGNYVEQKLRSDYYRTLYTNDKTFIFVTAGLSYDEADVSYQNIGTQGPKIVVITSPLVMGLEYKAINWLTLRTSVAQNVLIDQSKFTNGLTDYDRANLESTTIAAGLSVYFGNLQIDATFAGSDASYTQSGTTAAGSSLGRLDATNLATNTSLTYTF